MTVSPEMRGVIIGMLRGRKRICEVVRETGISLSTVKRLKKEAANNNWAVPKAKAKSGRNKNVSLGHLGRSRRLITRQPTILECTACQRC